MTSDCNRYEFSCQSDTIFLEFPEVDNIFHAITVNVDHSSVRVKYGLGQHFIIVVSVVDVTDLHVIVHGILVFGLLTTLLTQEHNAAPVPPVLSLTGNTGKHLVAGWVTGARDGVELRVPVDAQS